LHIFWSFRIIIKRKLRAYQIVAVVITLLGVIPIGISESMEKAGGSSGLDEDGERWQMAVSILVLFASQLFCGIRDVVEEKVIQKQKISTEFVIFMEGVYGLGFSVIALIACNFIEINGRQFESLSETFDQVLTNNGLQMLLLGNIILTGIHNYSTTLITEKLSSLYNVLISQVRPMVSFFVSLTLYYLISGHEYGEKYSNWSLIKFVGFGMFIVAALIYSGNLRLPCKSCYPVDEVSESTSEAKAENQKTDSEESGSDITGAVINTV
jgi:drug/metabolite transporter (DMT)-like permease